MAVVYRCDACNKLVENDEDIVKMKFMCFPMANGIPYKFADWGVYKLLCPDCKKKLFDFAKIKLTEEEKDNG